MPKTSHQEEKAVEAPTESPTPSSFEDTVLNLLTEMSQRLTAVEQAQAEPAGPRFVDPPIHRNTAAADRSRRALAANPDGIPHSDTIPIFPSGEKVPAVMMRQFAPKFGTGDIVALDLAAVPHGRADGRTRGELMHEKGVPIGYGEVIDRTFLSDTSGSWKYKVRFDPKVMPGSNGGIVYLYEPELIPA